MSSGFMTSAYIAATVLFILALGGLSNQEKAKRAIWFGIVGMALAVFATIFGPQVHGLAYFLLVPLLGAGAVAGIYVARRVKMTEMPQLVAALHSFVGLAAVFIGINSDIGGPHSGALADHGAAAGHAAITNAEMVIHQVEVFLGVFIGAVTFTGSIVAYGKLAGSISGKPLTLPGRNLLNLVMVLASIGLMAIYLATSDSWTLYVMTLIALVLGAHLVLAIGGADMPVVVSMLNSYSGWAAAATGFLLGNDLLIVTGALVGASGAILSYIMCRAMNRSFISVILGGFGTGGGTSIEVEGEMVATDVHTVASQLENASSVIIVPGYGMAVAQAQASVSELTRRLRAKDINVRFGIHPVAGRLPGSHERAARGGKGSLRPRVGNGRNQSGFSHRRMLSSSSVRTTSSILPHRRIHRVRLRECRYLRSGRRSRSSCASGGREPVTQESKIRCSTRKTRACSTVTRRRPSIRFLRWFCRTGANSACLHNSVRTRDERHAAAYSS